MSGLTIGQLAKAAEVHIETIRYYERRGLIPKAPRRMSGYRQFSQEDVRRIRFIKHAKALGFTLEEVAELLVLKREPASTCGDIIEKIETKLIDIDGKLGSLQRMKTTLVALKKACKTPEASSKDCPILESLDADDGKTRG